MLQYQFSVFAGSTQTNNFTVTRISREKWLAMPDKTRTGVSCDMEQVERVCGRDRDNVKNYAKLLSARWGVELEGRISRRNRDIVNFSLARFAEKDADADFTAAELAAIASKP